MLKAFVHETDADTDVDADNKAVALTPHTYLSQLPERTGLNLKPDIGKRVFLTCTASG